MTAVVVGSRRGEPIVSSDSSLHALLLRTSDARARLCQVLELPPLLDREKRLKAQRPANSAIDQVVTTSYWKPTLSHRTSRLVMCMFVSVGSKWWGFGGDRWKVGSRVAKRGSYRVNQLLYRANDKADHASLFCYDATAVHTRYTRERSRTNIP